MTKRLLNVAFIFFTGILIMASSCSKDETLAETDLDAYAEEVIFRTQQEANMGPFGCYELVFPVTLVFPDRTTADVNSYEAMKKAFIDWRKDNRRVKARPQFQFPYELINEDGEVITVENLRDQAQVRKDCRETFLDDNGPAGHNDRPKFCFRIVFPLTIHFPDGTTFGVNNREEFNQAVRRWRAANPDATRRPIIGLPFTVELRNGNTVEITTREQLQRLRAMCR